MQQQPNYESDRHLSAQNDQHNNEITLHDLRAAQMKRSALEKICTEPYFAEFISRKTVPIPNDPDYERLLPGLFCRVYIGDRPTSSGTHEPIYRICEMLGIQDYPRSYQLTDKRTMVNFGLLVQHVTDKRVFKIIQTSNSPFTQKEFDNWKQTMIEKQVRLPAKDDLSEAFLSASKLHKNFKYDKAQINKMRKKKAQNYNARNLANPHKEKLRVSTLLNGMNDDENDANNEENMSYDERQKLEHEKQRLEQYLADINREIDRRNSVNSHAVKISIASINEKNKIKNKKLMLKAREKERRLRIANRGKKQVSDPFTRAITAPKIESFNSALPLDDEKEKAKSESVEASAKKVKKKSKHEEDMEALQKLSILEEHEKRKKSMKNSNESSLDADGEMAGNGKFNGNGGLLIKNDKLWNEAIHSVACDFVQKCKNISMDFDYDGMGMLKQPQFGRNTNKSKYGKRFMKRPHDLQIISIDEYLKTKKYSAM